MHKCEQCGKEFDNGRALGGHISGAHNEEARLKHSKTLTLERISVTKQCENCGNDFEVKRIINKDGSERISKKEKRFCSYKCSNIRVFTEEQNKSKGKKGKENHYYIDGRSSIERYCTKCGKSIKSNNKSGYCKTCFHEEIPVKVTNEMREKVSKAQFALVKSGKHHGWSSRNKLSFPEQFFLEVLKNNDLIKGRDFFINHPVSQESLGLNNKKHYFLDFYFPSIKLDLEIDGRQHEDRIEYDKLRNKHLISNNYKVYRIKWKEILSKSGKKYIKNEIDKFIKYYNSLLL